MATSNETCIVNELLTYAIHYIHSSAIDNIKKVVQQFYSEDEILEAKRLLWRISADDLGPLPERKSTKVRNASIANINDIFDSLVKLDVAEKLPDVSAKNIDKLPNRQPEEMNLLYVVQRIAELEKSNEELQETLTNHAIDILKLKERNSTSIFKESLPTRDKNDPWQLSPHAGRGTTADEVPKGDAADEDQADDAEEIRLEKIIRQQEREDRNIKTVNSLNNKSHIGENTAAASRLKGGDVRLPSSSRDSSPARGRFQGSQPQRRSSTRGRGRGRGTRGGGGAFISGAPPRHPGAAHGTGGARPSPIGFLSTGYA